MSFRLPDECAACEHCLPSFAACALQAQRMRCTEMAAIRGKVPNWCPKQRPASEDDGPSLLASIDTHDQNLSSPEETCNHELVS